jgi:hypothetical protein
MTQEGAPAKADAALRSGETLVRVRSGRRAVLVPDLVLTVPTMRRCRGCRTVQRLKCAWLGNTAAVMHYLRIVNSQGSQWAHRYDD